MGQTSTAAFDLGQLHEHLPAKFSYEWQQTPASRAVGHSIPRYLIEHGQNTFEDLEQDAERLSLERPLATLSASALRALQPGRVFRCNTEDLYEGMSECQGCDVLVTMASGIKPWHFASQLRHSLKHHIVVDQTLSQLRFAFDARQAIGEAPNWPAICALPGHSSITEAEPLARHDAIYRSIRAGRIEWRFETSFINADLLTQTFRIADLIQGYRPRKLVFWYSNIFQPFFNSRFSEDRYQVEASFARLMLRRFPGALLYNANRRPVRPGNGYGPSAFAERHLRRLGISC
jgi:hypothetical protein